MKEGGDKGLMVVYDVWKVCSLPGGWDPIVDHPVQPYSVLLLNTIPREKVAVILTRHI